MGLIESLNTPADHDEACKFRDIRESLSDDERIALDEALVKVIRDERSSRAKRFSYRWLAGVLTDNGYPISRTSIARHVNEVCSCGKQIERSDSGSEDGTFHHQSGEDR